MQLLVHIFYVQRRVLLALMLVFGIFGVFGAFRHVEAAFILLLTAKAVTIRATLHTFLLHLFAFLPVYLGDTLRSSDAQPSILIIDLLSAK